MNWNAYVTRRSIKVDQWLQARDVRDSQTFLRLLKELKIEPPSVDQIISMFPAAQPKVEKGVSDGSAGVTSEGSGKIATRSVAGERDGTGQRPDGKRGPKVRN